MLNLIEMEILSLEHKLRVNGADRWGWMLPTAQRRSPTKLVGSAVNALFARLEPAAAGRLGWQRTAEYRHTLGPDHLS